VGLSFANLRKAIRGAIGPWAIDRLYGMVSRRDWPGVQTLGRKLGRFAYRVARRHRHQAAANVRYAFGPELTEARVQEIVLGSLTHTITLFLETLRLSYAGEEECRRICRIHGEEYLRAALAEGRGVIMFSGHVGNWEVGAMRLIFEGYPFLPLSRPPSDPRLARKFQEVRGRQDFPVLLVQEGFRGILRALKENKVVPIMPDRFAKGQGVTVPFFGHPTHVWHTPAVVHARTGAPVIAAHTFRGPDGTYDIVIEPPVEMQQTDDRDADLLANTARTMTLLEARIRQYPEQYPWQYVLWRGGEADMPGATSAPPQSEELFSP
jgi:Kdo2-lipid IVA lauroyltransferase/acyltransferase